MQTMKIEKLNYEKKHLHTYPSTEICLDKLNELIDAFNSFEKITVLDGYMKMCEKCTQIPATICSCCVPAPKKESKYTNSELNDKDTELLRCPFCGEHPEISESVFGWAIACRTGVLASDKIACTVRPMSNFKNTKQEAIDAWNRRAS